MSKGVIKMNKKEKALKMLREHYGVNIMCDLKHRFNRKRNCIYVEISQHEKTKAHRAFNECPLITKVEQHIHERYWLTLK